MLRQSGCCQLEYQAPHLVHEARLNTHFYSSDHEVAEHPPHENAKHKESHQEHEEAKHNGTFQCSHCSLKFYTIHEKDAHEKSRHLSSTVPRIGYARKQLASPGTSQCSHAEVDESSHDPAESQTSDEETSSLDEEDISHPSDDGPSIARSQDLICRSAIYKQPCTCSISQRPPTSPLSSACDDDKFDDLPDDASSIASGGGDGQDGPAEDFQAACLCIFCSQVFDTDEDLRGHICASRGTIFQFPFHCSFCYTQFDDESSLLKHLEEDRISFRCHLCQMLSCSNDMLQDHLLDHPACCKCGKVFIDDLALCDHVGSEHPIVVCWDCDGAVVEQDSLELHYAVSPEHPSCRFCGVGKRIPDDMEEHIKNQHATELHDSTPNDIAVSQSNGQAAIDSSSNMTGDEESVLVEKQPATDNEDGLGPEALGEPEPEPPSPTSVETPMHEEHHEPHTSPPQTEPSLSLTIAPLLCSAALLLLFVIRRCRRK
ncbi:hypothetical protein PAXINDRAFT_21398 [Paxillus involutus ATCC 200175]|uniref:C2H2-type domain-containing protein n=1 Tax=Paxillus involutus ATCC 200175 TaxID=664439 RepID=A0A0C9TAT6_PAXIN|nr:hypothetical protein PAXINDRAFT_21398 [Paxillus involutus ATCC 200175]